MINFSVRAPIALLLLLAGSVWGASNKVVELSDRFLELRGDSTWLIMFYAPWCGHCRKLEPAWGHVAQALHGTPIRVGRVDATRFTALAAEFDVKGFPTIIFVRGPERHLYDGDRTTADIVGFGRRVSGQPLPHISELPRLPYMPTAPGGREKEEGGMFVYGGVREGKLWDVYSWLAEEYRYYHYFYSMDQLHFEQLLGRPVKGPTVAVHKDSTNLLYPEPALNEGLNESLSLWVNHERFPFFMRITPGNLPQVFKCSKSLAMVVVAESKTGLLTTDETAEQYVDGYKFRDMLQSVARKKREVYHQHFQFGWTGSPHLANNLAISRLPLPSLLVVNTSSLRYHLPETEAANLTHALVEQFLDAILNESDQGFGGDSYLVRVQRTLFRGRTSLEDMWHGNPVLTALLLGLPLGFLSLILYSVCCGDILDAADDDGEDGDARGVGVEEYERRLRGDMHEKKD